MAEKPREKSRVKSQSSLEVLILFIFKIFFIYIIA